MPTKPAGFPDYITFNKKKLKELKTAYAVAVINRSETFRYEGRVFLTGYAKYVIEYLESRFANG